MESEILSPIFHLLNAILLHDITDVEISVTYLIIELIYLQ